MKKKWEAPEVSVCFVKTNENIASSGSLSQYYQGEFHQQNGQGQGKTFYYTVSPNLVMDTVAWWEDPGIGKKYVKTGFGQIRGCDVNGV